MALTETNELVLKHSATGTEHTTHQFQSFYVKHTDDKGETHYVPVQVEWNADSDGDHLGVIVPRTHQES